MSAVAGGGVATLFVAIVANGLLAGMFFTFAVAISPGLRRVDDEVFVGTVRSVNRVILRPAFLMVFAAAPVSAVVATVLAGGEPLTLAGAIAALVSFAVTALGNVPRNRDLDRAGAQPAGLVRARYERPWNRANVVRTIASVLALLLLTAAAVR
ncbi:anthrone oxygenase family protein [Microbacterium gorillae]|uniref:anthrone oxygenase family protein n=1 Tax=Microbacterium gorillae TaxID=1231063 RepID=UPI00058F7D21|nr:anthrone oxygenase family protein [Microbacterium gorillae]